MPAEVAYTSLIAFSERLMRLKEGFGAGCARAGPSMASASIQARNTRISIFRSLCERGRNDTRVAAGLPSADPGPARPPDHVHEPGELRRDDQQCGERLTPSGGG